MFCSYVLHRLFVLVELSSLNLNMNSKSDEKKNSLFFFLGACVSRVELYICIDFVDSLCLPEQITEGGKTFLPICFLLLTQQLCFLQKETIVVKVWKR